MFFLGEKIKNVSIFFNLFILTFSFIFIFMWETNKGFSR